MLAGLIFDLDGTLVDSRLDFDAMRHEMGLVQGLPILEAMDEMSAERRAECEAILLRHEFHGAHMATPFPGVCELLCQLAEMGLRFAVVTRNSRDCAAISVAKLPATFDTVICREDGPIKPHPWAVEHICQHWNVAPSQTALIGDYRFDIECGKAAGAKTAFFAASQPFTHEDVAGADITIECFSRPQALLQMIRESA